MSKVGAYSIRIVYIIVFIHTYVYRAIYCKFLQSIKICYRRQFNGRLTTLSTIILVAVEVVMPLCLAGSINKIASAINKMQENLSLQI